MAKIVSTLREAAPSDTAVAPEGEKKSPSLVTGLGVVLIIALIGASLLLVFSAVNL